MSTLYLISQYTDEISAAVSGTTSAITGNYVVRVPDDVQVQNPTSLSNLVTQKYTGTLGAHGLFTQIVYDDMLDGTGVDTAASAGICTGKNGTVGLYPLSTSQTPVLQTLPTTITWGGPGPGPAEAMLVYEVFEYADTDVADSVYQRSYQELTADIDVSAEVSFDNGTTFLATVDRGLLLVPSGAQGTNVIVRFTRVTNVSVRDRVFIGSWAVLF